MTIEPSNLSQPNEGNEFFDAFEASLPEIDAELEEHEVPVGERVTAATHLFLEHCDIVIGEKRQPVGPDVMGQPWLRPLYQVARRWYEQKYAAASAPNVAPLEAVFLIGRTPYLVRIPKFAKRVEVENELTWMIWSSSVRDNEKPLSWVVDAPNFGAMSAADRAKCDASVRELVTMVRTGWLNLVGVKCATSIERELAGQCLVHLQGAARLLVDYRRSGQAGLAPWEVHQALEKSLKLYIRQRGRTPDRTHDLRALAASAHRLGNLTLDLTLLQQMPTSGEMIELRAGEREAGPLADAMKMYRSGLRLFIQITGGLKRDINVHDAEILLKKPPWA